jgi:hypothetical protein
MRLRAHSRIHRFFRQFSLVSGCTHGRLLNLRDSKPGFFDFSIKREREGEGEAQTVPAHGQRSRQSARLRRAMR